MRAATIKRYGSPDVIEITEVDRPMCGAGEVLIAVRAASVNPYDWHSMTGTPFPLRFQGGLRRPKNPRLGIDVAGVIEAVGENVTKFAVGDEVFGGASGAFAEFVTVNDKTLVRKPENTTFEEAAAVPVGALTAVQGLRDKGMIEAGQRVLVNGAAGGVGTYAIQLAKHFGADVTGVCSTRNIEMVSALGADHVVDYTADDFTDHGIAYDLILDNVGNRKVKHLKRCMTPTGNYVMVGAPKDGVLGPIGHMMTTLLRFKFGKRRGVSFVAKHTLDDMELFRDLLSSGEMRSVIDTSYPLDQAADALRQLSTGHARGKIIITP